MKMNRFFIQTKSSFSLLEYSSDHQITQTMIWHLLYQIAQVYD